MNQQQPTITTCPLLTNAINFIFQLAKFVNEHENSTELVKFVNFIDTNGPACVETMEFTINGLLNVEDGDYLMYTEFIKLIKSCTNLPFYLKIFREMLSNRSKIFDILNYCVNQLIADGNKMTE